MIANLWHRTKNAARDRMAGSALAGYGAGLHGECDDCAVSPADTVVPAQQRRQALTDTRPDPVDAH